MAALGGFAGSVRWSEGSAASVNDAGVIVGASRHPKTAQQNPYQWSGGTFADLGALGMTGTWAQDLNDANPAQIVGATETDSRRLTTRACIGSASTSKVLIPPLPGGGSNSATAINNLGHVVGSSSAEGSQQHAFRQVGTTVTDLGTLGGPWSTAQDINDAGVIVGASRIDATTRGQPIHAFLYSEEHGMRDLGTLGGLHSWAYGINHAGVVVGSAITSAGTESAFVYDSIHGMRDLNALTAGSGWTLNVARSINRSGQIVGWGLNPQGIRRAFLLTPKGTDRRNGSRILGIRATCSHSDRDNRRPHQVAASLP
jgi:probable HAF family extracellular repeat protein